MKVNKPWKIIIMTFANLMYNLTNIQNKTYRKIERTENKVLKNNLSNIFIYFYI